MNNQDNNFIGVIYGLLATLLWGSYPLWYKPLSAVGAWELFAWRIIWAQFFLLIIVFIIKRNNFLIFLKSFNFFNAIIVAIILAFWWFLYIYGVLNDRILEVALGYFLSPIISICLSKLIFKERTNKLQNTAIFLAVCSIFIMIMGFVGYLSSFPWVAITLGFAFSLYGVFKKLVKTDLNQFNAQTFEILFLMPIAILILTYTSINSKIAIYWLNNFEILLLILTGLITVLPLWWYSIAAKKISALSLSFLQFITPSANFLLGIFVYKETLELYKLSSFILIWIAIIILIYNSVIQYKNNI